MKGTMTQDLNIGSYAETCFSRYTGWYTGIDAGRVDGEVEVVVFRVGEEQVISVKAAGMSAAAC